MSFCCVLLVGNKLLNLMILHYLETHAYMYWYMYMYMYVYIFMHCQHWREQKLIFHASGYCVVLGCRYDFARSDAKMVITTFHWHAHSVADVCFTSDGKLHVGLVTVASLVSRLPECFFAWENKLRGVWERGPLSTDSPYDGNLHIADKILWYQIFPHNCCTLPPLCCS